MNHIPAQFRRGSPEDDMHPQKNEQMGPEFGLADIIALVQRRLRLILALFVAVAVSGVAITMLQTPTYTATSLMMINPKQDRVVSEQQALTEMSPDSAFVDSEIEVLRSPDLAARLVKALQLEEDPEFNVSLRAPSLFDGVRDAVSGIIPSQSLEDVLPVDLDEGTWRAVAEAISVRRRGLSYVMEISVTSEDPTKAAQMANVLGELYLRGQLEARFETADQANVWLTGRLEELKAEVQKKEAAAQSYRAAKGLLTAQGVSLTEQQIAEVQTSVMASRAEFAEKQARYRQVKDLIDSGGSADTIAGVLNSEVIRELRVQESSVAQRQADLENRYGPLHPSVEKVRLERTDIQSQIKSEISRIAANLRNEAEVVRSRLQTLESNLGSVRGNLISNNAELVRLNELETDARAARAVYESFLQRFHEVAQQGSLGAVEARVVSKARPPNVPSSPNLILALALSLMLGVGAAGAGTMIAEQFNQGLTSSEDVDRNTGLPTLASIPALQPKDFRLLQPNERHPAGYLSQKPMSGFAESFRVLRTSVLYSTLNKSSKVVAFTSAMPNEGKTTASLCFARISSLSGQSVVLVDCDLRRRTLNEVLGIAPKEGLVQVLSGQADWRSVVGTDMGSGVHVLPVAEGGFTPMDLFGSVRMKGLVEELSSAYDLVIFDCPPVLAVAETRILVKHADAVVVACRWGKTPLKAVLSAVSHLRAVDAPLIGVALNCVDTSAQNRGSYYDNLYYRSAENYYEN